MTDRPARATDFLARLADAGGNLRVVRNVLIRAFLDHPAALRACFRDDRPPRELPELSDETAAFLDAASTSPYTGFAAEIHAEFFVFERDTVPRRWLDRLCRASGTPTCLVVDELLACQGGALYTIPLVRVPILGSDDELQDRYDICNVGRATTDAVLRRERLHLRALNTVLTRASTPVRAQLALEDGLWPAETDQGSPEVDPIALLGPIQQAEQAV